MIRASVSTCVLLLAIGAYAAPPAPLTEWFRNAVVYQIYPRSFKDSNGDGIGDLNGITSKLEHIADIGADALWLSPIFASPQVDFGYDISNFTDINPEYGTLADFDRLVAKAKSLGLRVLLDFVPNHSSHEHPWFKKSVNRTKPYDEYYIWRDGRLLNGTRYPPNNWLSVFGGSAWEWNEERGQYYFHQFAAGQPDLNYRNAALDLEMKSVLTFWADRGVDGYRIDAINHLVEDVQLLDEPRSENQVPLDDYESLDHIYTRDLNDTYFVLKSWRKVLDDHSKKNKSDAKLILTEAYTRIDLTMRYYEMGSNAPFNFQFIADLNNRSTAVDFKRSIDRWMNNIPSLKMYVPNWVVGNHDNHRAATRYGSQRADQLNILASILPGITVIYNGDEIGMEDRHFSYAETVDPAGCNAGPERYHLKSRDPERTPYQWDNTTSAGFSTSNKTWLPVHENYRKLNLAAEKIAPESHYKVFKALVALKKTPIVANGTLEVTLVTEKVLGVVRRLPGEEVPVVALINFSPTPVVVDARSWLNIPEQLSVYLSNVGSRIPIGIRLDTTYLPIPGSGSMVLASRELVSEVSPF